MHALNLLVSAEQGIDLGMMSEEPNQSYDATNPEARRFSWERCKEHHADLCRRLLVGRGGTRTRYV